MSDLYRIKELKREKQKNGEDYEWLTDEDQL